MDNKIKIDGVFRKVNVGSRIMKNGIGYKIVSANEANFQAAEIDNPSTVVVFEYGGLFNAYRSSIDQFDAEQSVDKIDKMLEAQSQADKKQIAPPVQQETQSIVINTNPIEKIGALMSKSPNLINLLTEMSAIQLLEAEAIMRSILERKNTKHPIMKVLSTSTIEGRTIVMMEQITAE